MTLNTPHLNCDVPALWLEHQSALLLFIKKRVPDTNTAEDIAQEVLMKVYKFCSTKSGVGNVRSWLFQIAQNTIIDYQRRQNKITYELPELKSEEENFAFIEASEFILPILNLLPEAYAIPLRMSDIEGIKQAEIAEKLQLSLSATKSRIQRARQLLKAEFLYCCDIETDSQGNVTTFQVKDFCKPLQKIIKEKEN